MRSREVRKLLFDVEKACDLVLKFTRGITLDAFLRDDMVQSAVERQSEIIGEALKQAVGLDQTLSERISDVSRIIAFRNRLIHGYASVSPQVVWGIVTNDIPKLLTEIREVMGETPTHDT